MGVLSKSAALLHVEVRRGMVMALLLMRNRGMIPALPLLKLFFQLFRVQDKLMREVVFSHIIADIKNLNRPSGGTGSRRKVKLHPSEGNRSAVNRALQSFMYTMLQDTSTAAARKSMDVLIELFRRRIWTDARTVNAIAGGCVSGQVKLVVPACRFLCGELDLEEEDEPDSEDEAEMERKAQAYRKAHRPNASDLHLYSKKTRKRARQAKRNIAKMRMRTVRPEDKVKTVFPAISMLHDPQGLAERMLRGVRGNKFRFEVRLLMLNTITRTVGQHKLVVLGLYPFLQRYLTAHQRHVTSVMAYLIQACHEAVPPSELLPVVKGIANTFITERCPPEVMQVGLNAVKEVIARAPALLEEEGAQDLVQDLVLYRKDRDKGVVMASRGILNTVRELYPTLLARKDRGKGHDADAVPTAFGALPVVSDVLGADLLAAERALAGKGVGNEDDDEDAWKVAAAAAGDGDSSDWEDVSDEEGAAPAAQGGGGALEGWEEDRPEPLWARRQRLRRERREREAALAAGAAAPDASAEKEASEGGEGSEEHGSESEEEEEETGHADDGSGGQAAAPALPVAAMRFLTPADFERLKALRSAASDRVRRGTKRPRAGDGPDIEDVVAMALKAAEANSAAVVGFNPDDIESGRTLKKRQQAERALEVRATTGSKRDWQPNRAGGSTNAEKARSKNYMMLRKSRDVQMKMKSSLVEQKRTIRKHMTAISKQTKHERRKRRRK